VGIGVFAGLVGVGILGIWLTGRSPGRQPEDELVAFSSLKALAAAEADFRENDRDQNGVKDFWTADVASLYNERLIDRATADADALPLVPLVPKPVPKGAYYFVALELDDSANPPEAYRQITDKSSGKVHHLKKFAFLAYPVEAGKPGRYLFIINEYNTVWRALDSGLRPKNWPTEQELKKSWSAPS
jgi:hypothetical protein